MGKIIKNKNSEDIYRYIYDNDGASRQMIADELNLSLPTVTNCLDQLSKIGLIYASGVYASTGGRKARMIKCVPDVCFSVGIDITKNHISIALIDLDIKTHFETRIRLPFSNTDEYYASIAYELEKVLDDNGVPREKLSGVGISMPVIFNADHKSVFYASVIDIDDNSYEKIISHIPYDCLLFNDADSAGIAERRASDEPFDMLYLSLSNSVGGSAIINDSTITGNNNKASEFGHMCIVPHGKRCYCGREGCLDAYCAASNLSDFTDGDLVAFFEELKKGQNPGLMRTFDEYLDYLAYAVNNLRICYDCSIVIGGYVGAHMHDYMDILRAKVLQLSSFDTKDDFIQPCHYMREAAAVGAGIHFIDKFVEEI